MVEGLVQVALEMCIGEIEQMEEAGAVMKVTESRVLVDFEG